MLRGSLAVSCLITFFSPVDFHYILIILLKPYAYSQSDFKADCCLFANKLMPNPSLVYNYSEEPLSLTLKMSLKG